ncbi:MAG: energy transducer TonB [Candidatus Solibacter sp.]
MTNLHQQFRPLGLLLIVGLTAGMLAAQDAPKKVTKTEGLNAVTTKVSPEYPAIARQLKIEGAVELEVIVTEAGTVEKVNIVSGNPVLTRPASDAVKKWKFAPFTADGKAVKAAVPVSMSFKM